MRKIILYLLGIIILSFYIYKLEFVNTIKECSSGVNYLILGGVMSLTILIPIIRAFRWKYVAGKIVGIKLGFFEAFKLTSISYFISCATPFKIGDFSRTFFHKKNYSSVMAGISIELLFDFIVLLLIPTFFFTMNSALFIVYILLIILTFSSFIFFLIKIKLNFLNHLPFLLKFLSRFTQIQENLSVSFKKIFKHPDVMVICFAVSAIFYLGCYFCTYLIFQAIGLNIDLFTSLKGLSLSQALGTISMIPMGLGTKELVAVNFFSNYSSRVLVALLLSRFLALIPLLLGCYFYMTRAGELSISIKSSQDGIDA